MENESDIAVVGLSCRFPGAQSPQQFWENLSAGVESIARFSDSELLESGVSPCVLKDPSYVKAAPVLDGPGSFDASFFGFTPAEARAMDPQHRILLELAHEALEDAGCNPDCFSGRIGVFTGSAMNTYFMRSGLSQKFAQDYIPTLIVNDKDFLSTRISYKLNLKGPSITIQTACSTSLVAVHLARQSLLSGESDVALAGAISIRVPHRAGYFCDGGGVVSPDGRVRAFDAEANGTVFGSGGGIIVLRRLADAIADGDNIHAVIKGSAVNNDGSEKAGYTAPSVNSQADVIVEALANAGVDAESVSYIEAHGSGTPVGDPIEVAALTKAFRVFTERSGYCAIGSVKSNIGHLDAAAGIAGIVKTILALKHRQLPPTLNYNRPNPEIDFPTSPFYVNAKLIPWTSNGPRIAGIMSTGMGGTNAHVVIEEAPPVTAPASSGLPQLLVLSGKNDNALDKATSRLRDFLLRDPAPEMADVAWTLQTGRKALPCRRYLVCSNRKAAVATLTEERSKQIVSSQVGDAPRRPVVFLLPGIGDHYLGMGGDLYRHYELFATEVDRCARLLEPELGVDIREIIYPNKTGTKADVKNGKIDLRKMLDGNGAVEADPAAHRLNQTIYAQPALFTVEYALSRLWQHLGMSPTAIVGHSMGEYVAGCLAGVFSLEDALRLIARRAKLVNELPQAAMLAVALPEAELLPLLNEQLSIALINGLSLCVVAGARSEIAHLKRELNEKSIITRPVQNGHAFHSKLLDSIVSPYVEEVKKVQLHEPKIPFISNVTGKWINKAQATDPMHWACHSVQTARFSDALACLWQFKDPILLEAGPGKTLSVLATQHPHRQAAGNPIHVSSLRHHYENQSDIEFFLQNVGTLWLSGAAIRWENLPPAKRCRKIQLPTYPFERQNYWLETITEAPIGKELSIHKETDRSKWFYVPSWKRTLAKTIGLAELTRQKQQRWIVFTDERGLASQIVDRLNAAGHGVVVVNAGTSFRQLDPHRFTLAPGNSDDYERLAAVLQADSFVPDHVIHAWTLSGIDSFARAQDLGFYSLLFLARALAKQDFEKKLNFFVLSNQVQEVHGNETLAPEKSTLLGPCIVIPQEYPNIRVKSIDLSLPLQSEIDDLTIDRLFGEFLLSDSELFIAHRNAHRWIRTYEQVELNENDGSVFRECGAYLITGGLGNIGYEISKYLAKNYKARLVLVGRSPLPERKLWEAWVTSHPIDDPITEKIRRITEIEKLGAGVLYLDASVDDRESMRQVFNHAQRHFSDLRGVIHAAGIVEEKRWREIKDIDHEHGDAYFQIKVKALDVMEELLRDKELDFVQLISSLTSLLGGIGHAAYASSCIYMDALARTRSRVGATPWFSVNWDFWRTQDRENARNTGFGATTSALGMSTDEALAAMEMILPARHAGQLIVSTGDLQARINQWVKLESLHRGAQAIPVTAPEVPQRRTLSPRHDLPRNKAERRVAEIWQNAFGIEHVGINDHFSDLGGHSLLAIKIVSELRHAFQIDLPIKALFDTPTVAELCAFIESQRNGVSSAPAVDEIHDQGGTRSRPGDFLELIRRENPDLKAENAFIVPRWFIQQTTWLEDPSGSDSAVYNYSALLRIRGPLQENILRQSLHEIVQRHEPLRSVFRKRGGELAQIVVPQSVQALQLTNLSDLPMPEREARAHEIALNEANRIFDLARGPLLRSALMRLAPDDHILQLTTHQIVYDDWSNGLLARELSELYQAYAAGEASPLSKLTFQYHDFVRWQEEQLRKEKSDLSFREAQLESATPFHHLETDLARPDKPTKLAAYERLVLPTDLADSLKALSRQERVSLFMVLLAGFKSLLYQYSDHSEIGVGSCAANRSLTEVEKLIGRFGNAMLLRTSLAGNPTFRELLMRVRETTLTAYSKQDAPFGMLLNKARNESDIGKAPFQVMFILQNAPQEPPQVPGLTMNWSTLDPGTAAYDLNVWLKTEPALEIVFEYSTDLFRAARMKQILADYRVILQRMAKDPEARIGNPDISTKPTSNALKYVRIPAKTVTDGRRNGAPKDDVQGKLVDIWESLLPVNPVRVDDNFFELGGDSLLAMRLFPKIKKAFAVDLPLATLLEAPTVRRLARVISNGYVASSLVAVQPSGKKPPLFCVPGVTGEIFFCERLSRSLGGDQPVFGLRLKGNNSSRKSIEEMAAHCLSEMKTVQPSGPYFLCGYCFGGLVAYEIAQILKKQDEEVALLALFNTPTPDGLKDWPLGPACLRKRISYELKKAGSLPMHQQLVTVATKASLLCAHAARVMKAALWQRVTSLAKDGRNQRLFDVTTINYLAAKNYRPASYPGRITFFSTAELSSRYSIDPTLAWTELAQDGIEAYRIPGENKSMFNPPHVDALAAELSSCLARANEPVVKFCHDGMLENTLVHV